MNSSGYWKTISISLYFSLLNSRQVGRYLDMKGANSPQGCDPPCWALGNNKKAKSPAVYISTSEPQK